MSTQGGHLSHQYLFFSLTQSSRIIMPVSVRKQKSYNNAEKNKHIQRSYMKMQLSDLSNVWLFIICWKRTYNVSYQSQNWLKKHFVVNCVTQLFLEFTSYWYQVYYSWRMSQSWLSFIAGRIREKNCMISVNVCLW